jgi:hypothetical protein
MLRLASPILFAVLLAMSGGAALALPAPLSDSDLLLKSDLVALVRIWSVTCVSVTKDERTGEELPAWSANAELIEVIKGDEPKGSDITITFRAIPKGLLGPWSVSYYPGEMVWTHLVGKNGTYTTTWWNGRGTVVEKAMIPELPTTPGETAALKRKPRQFIDQ